MSWRLANALVQLRAEVNAAAPRRNRASDGTIGDTAHGARLSDHNPNRSGVVRAMDITDDPAGGVDGTRLAEAVRRLGIAGHPALGPGAYVIHNRRIASATRDGAPWDWEPYNGTNPHTKHVHVSVATAAAGYDNRTPWRVMAKEHPERPLVTHALEDIAKSLQAKHPPTIRRHLLEAQHHLLQIPRKDSK